MPDEADIYEKGNVACLYKSHLKVMLEEDYLALQKHSLKSTKSKQLGLLGANIVRAIILPQLEKEVNEDKNFAPLRQVFSGMILAAWYKRALRGSLLGKIYANKAKVRGVDQDPKNNEAIYQQYLKAYKKGVFNYIKEDVDKYTNKTIPRKYFSGGATDFAMATDRFGNIIYKNGLPVIKGLNVNPPGAKDEAMRVFGNERSKFDLAQISVDPDKVSDAAMNATLKKLLLWGTPLLLAAGGVGIGYQAVQTHFQNENNQKIIEMRAFFSDISSIEKIPVIEDGRDGYKIILKGNMRNLRLKKSVDLDLLKILSDSKYDLSTWGVSIDREPENPDPVGSQGSIKKNPIGEDIEKEKNNGDKPKAVLDPKTGDFTITIIVFDFPVKKDGKKGTTPSWPIEGAGGDKAQTSNNPGGIDMNAAHLNMNIKRDGNGVPLPVSQQDLDNIHIDGLVPVILEIEPAGASLILSQLTATSPAGASG